jgi:hypothetical protein
MRGAAYIIWRANTGANTAFVFWANVFIRESVVSVEESSVARKRLFFGER